MDIMQNLANSLRLVIPREWMLLSMTWKECVMNPRNDCTGDDTHMHPIHDCLVLELMTLTVNCLLK